MSEKTKPAQQKHPSAAAAVNARQAYHLSAQAQQSIDDLLFSYGKQNALCDIFTLTSHLAQSHLPDKKEVVPVKHDHFWLLELFYNIVVGTELINQ